MGGTPLRVLRIILPLLMLTACARLTDTEDDPRFNVCTMMACTTSIQIQFTNARSQKYKVVLEKPGTTISGECIFQSPLGPWEPTQTSYGTTARCDASRIRIAAYAFEKDSEVTVETFDASDISVERKKYSLPWSPPHYPNGKACGGVCYTADITSTAP